MVKLLQGALLQLRGADLAIFGLGDDNFISIPGAPGKILGKTLSAQNKGEQLKETMISGKIGNHAPIHLFFVYPYAAGG